jgi:hypothetical protein
MTASYDPVAELRSHGLAGDSLPQVTEEVLGRLNKQQVDSFIKVKEHVDTLSAAEVQAHSADDAELAMAMAKAIGWDKPAAEDGSDVEGMSMAAPECLCLCSTASGGGGGQALQ